MAGADYSRTENLKKMQSESTKRAIEVREQAEQKLQREEQWLQEEKAKEIAIAESSRLPDGTITLITNRMEDTAEQCDLSYYTTQRSREQFFDPYENPFAIDVSISFEGRLFLDHVSAEITAAALNAIADAGMAKD